MNHLEMIAALSNANGAPGFEDEVLLAARKYAPKSLTVTEDKFRNLYFRRPDSGKKPVVQLDAHTDEVAFMVQYINPNGTLHFVTLGGIVNSNIPAHRVRVQTKTGKWIPGVTAAKPPHFMTDAEKQKMPEVSDMAIDIGATSLEEVRDVYGVRVAAPVVPDVTFEYDDQHDTMIGKAFDCRLGCAGVLATLNSLEGETLDVDVVGALSVQEEMGLRGATVTSRTVKPDIAIVFEGCPADDTVVEPCAVQTAIRKGPMLRHIDARMITHPRFQRFALDLAEKLNIPCQEAVRTGGSTNGSPIHLSNAGVPCIVIGLPVRYIHSHYGIASYEDFQNAVKLAGAIIRELNADVLAGF
ncbi:MAG: M42 family peptidase [Eubacteriales bacterium]|nr:M42 family peptidase [Eubacteriales bacterium]